MPSTQAVKLKHFIDAAKGRSISWITAWEINNKLGTEYSGDVKISAIDRERLRTVIAEMEAKGVNPAKCLLTRCQRAALKKRSA